jgi:methylmalonyl-CoA carboxyltransferase 1.3S subunit
VKLKLGIEGKEYVVDIEVLEDDSLAPSYLPPHGPATTVQPLVAPLSGAEMPPLAGNVNEAKVCRSPVAGVVVKINAQPGQQLQTNDLIMVLEAMKMETNITAPIPGKVRKINVGESDGVKMNQVLVEFE